MKMSGANFEALVRDLEAALEEFSAPLARVPGLWTQGHAGKWTAGQQADHVSAGLAATAAALEVGERKLRDGVLRPRPGRGPLQALFVGYVVGTGRFPRGAKSPRAFWPTAAPDQTEVLERINCEAARHRAIGERLAPEERDRLWIPNPFLRRWHYAFPEVLRMQAVHARHHAKQIAEIAAQHAAR